MVVVAVCGGGGGGRWEGAGSALSPGYSDGV